MPNDLRPPIFLGLKESNIFEEYFNYLLKEYGDLASSSTNSAENSNVKKLLENLKSPIEKLVFQENTFLTTLSSLKDIHSSIQKLLLILLRKDDQKAKCALAYIYFMHCIMVYNMHYYYLVKSPINPLDHKEFFDQISKSLSESYYAVDYLLNDIVEENESLSNLRYTIFQNMRPLRKALGAEAISRDELTFHIERKNKYSKSYGLSFNCELIDNLDSVHVVRIDEATLRLLVQKIQEIRAKHKPRTQFLVRAYGALGHILALDVSFNSKLNRLEIVCLESASVKLQWDFLEILILQMSALSIRFHIIAIQSRLQKSSIGCPIFALFLANQSSKHSFEAMMRCSTEDQAFEKERIAFQNPFEKHDPKLDDLPPLNGVTWLPVTVLGLNALRAGQSSTEMKERLSLISKESKIDVDKTVSAWEKAYEWDKSKQKTYYEYKRNSLRWKYQETNFADLTVEKVLSKLKTNLDEKISLELGVRRLSAGCGPKRELEFLVSILEQRGQLNQLSTPAAESKRTALHFALLNGKASRACFLISKGATTHNHDRDGKTEKNCFDSSTHPDLRNNSYLKAKFSEPSLVEVAVGLAKLSLGR